MRGQGTLLRYRVELSVGSDYFNGTGTLLSPVRVLYGTRDRHAAEIPGRALGMGAATSTVWVSC